MKLKDIRKRLAEIKAEGTKLLDTADKNDGGALTEENQAKFNALMEESDALQEQAKRIEKLEALSVPAEPKSRPVQPASPEAEISSISNPQPVIESDPMRGFRSTAEFGHAVQSAGLHGGKVDDRLLAIRREDNGGIVSAPSSYMTEHGSSDGYMVPPQISANVTKLVMGGEGLLERFSPEPTTSNSVEDKFDQDTPWGSSGILAYWKAEAGQMSNTKPNTKLVRTELHTLYAFVLASDELLEDAPRLEQRLTVGAADAIRWKAEDSIVNGDGVGKPKGFHEADCLISVTKETGQSADTIDDQNILKARSKLLGDGNGAFWLAHRTTIPQLAAMTIGDQPMWLGRSGDLKDAPGGLLLGLPVVFSEHAQVLGDAGDIQLVQPKGYASYVKTGGIKFAMSMHLYFDYGLGAFRWAFRIGGVPKLSAAITMSKSDTASHFIDVAARA